MGMNEEEVRQLAKNILSEQMSEEIKKHLDSAIIFKYINDIEQQLQAHKDKEDKLREYIKHNVGLNMNDMEYVKKQLLQILNEGDE